MQRYPVMETYPQVPLMPTDLVDQVLDLNEGQAREVLFLMIRYAPHITRAMLRVATAPWYLDV